MQVEPKISYHRISFVSVATEHEIMHDLKHAPCANELPHISNDNTSIAKWTGFLFGVKAR